MTENKTGSRAEYTLVTLFDYLKSSWKLLLLLAAVFAVLVTGYAILSKSKLQTSGSLTVKLDTSNFAVNLQTAKELVDSGAFSDSIIKEAGLRNRSLLLTRARINKNTKTLFVSLIDTRPAEAKTIVRLTLARLKELFLKESMGEIEKLQKSLRQNEESATMIQGQITSLENTWKDIEKQYDKVSKYNEQKISELEISLDNYLKEKEMLLARLEQVREEQKQASGNVDLILAKNKTENLLLANLDNIHSQIGMVSKGLLDLNTSSLTMATLHLEKRQTNLIRLNAQRKSLATIETNTENIREQINDFEEKFIAVTEPVTDPSPKGISLKMVIAAAVVAYLGLVVMLSYLTWLYNSSKKS